MNAPFIEKTDVFLPGHGTTLTQAPAYHWQPADAVSGRVYFSTRDPDALLILLEGLDEEQRQRRPSLKIQLDRTGTQHHDFDGFGLHLPGITLSARGTAIALCQRRHRSMADCGNPIDILMSRSEDGGKTWQPQEVIFSAADTAAILGPVFAERTSGSVFVAFWKMPVDVLHDLEYFGEYARQGGGFWLLESRDEGRSWSPPSHIQPQPNDAGWVGWPNNCVHGIQLVCGRRAGRLVIPAFLYKEGEPGQVPGVRGGLLYSDDQAHSWKVGAVLPAGSDEVSLVETANARDAAAGSIYVSYRKNWQHTGKRHFARSIDGGESFHQHGQHEEVDCRNLHAGLARCGRPGAGPEDLILFSNPLGGSPARGLRVRLSRDAGLTWPYARLLEQGPCRYSDLAVMPDGTILCLYTTGMKRDREKISVARFNLAWLTGQL